VPGAAAEQTDAADEPLPGWRLAADLCVLRAIEAEAGAWKHGCRRGPPERGCTIRLRRANAGRREAHHYCRSSDIRGALLGVGRQGRSPHCRFLVLEVGQQRFLPQCVHEAGRDLEEIHEGGVGGLHGRVALPHLVAAVVSELPQGAVEQ